MEGKSLFNGYGVSVWEDEKVLDIDSGDSCTTMCMYLIQQNHTPKVVKIVNFMLCIFYHNKKIRNLRG